MVQIGPQDAQNDEKIDFDVGDDVKINKLGRKFYRKNKIKKEGEPKQYIKSTRPVRLESYNNEGRVKTILRLFRKWVIAFWDAMWLQVKIEKNLSCDKPYYYHTAKSRENSIKFFFTESDFGFKIPEEVFDRNKAVLKLLLLQTKMVQEQEINT